MAVTPNYSLLLPADGDVGWGAGLRASFTTIDTTMNQNNLNYLTNVALITSQGAAITTAQSDISTLQGEMSALDNMVSPPRVWSLNVEPIRTTAYNISGNYALFNSVENLAGMELQYPSIANGIWGFSMQDTATGITPTVATTNHNLYYYKPFTTYGIPQRTGLKISAFGASNVADINATLLPNLDTSAGANYDPTFAGAASYLNLIIGVGNSDTAGTPNLDGCVVYVQITRDAAATYSVRYKMYDNTIGSGTPVGYTIDALQTAAQVTAIIEGDWDLSIHTDQTAHFSINGSKKANTLIPLSPLLLLRS